jgi:hypothetical protein
MSNQNRMSRELDSREHQLHDAPWEPPSQIPTPDPQNGYKFRWIRTSVMGLDDARNVSMRRREGWVPVKAEDHPELLLDLGLEGSAPKTGLVLFGGLMLSKNLEENVVKRSNYYESMADQQMKSVDNNFLKQSDARMPLCSDRRAEVTFGRGNGK